MDLWNKLTTWADYNRYKAAAMVIVTVILVVGVGCESMTPSISDPGRRVARDLYLADVQGVRADLASQRADLDGKIGKFNAQVTAIDAQIAAGIADLEKQDQIRTELFDLAGSVVTAWTTGGVDTGAVVGTGLMAFSLLFGLGSAADGRRKDKIIADIKKPAV